MDFDDFSAEVAKCDFTILSRAVANAVKSYKDNYSSEIDAEARYKRFFKMIESELPVRRSKSRHRGIGNQVNTAYYQNIRRAEAYDRFVFAIYYWFRFRCDSKTYAAAIDTAIYGHPHAEPSDVFPFQSISDARQPILVLPGIEPLDEQKSNWLSPNVTTALPFVGRKAELNALTQFALEPAPFLMWAVSGPSGAGKTRLVTHWMRSFKERYDQSGDTARPWNIGYFGIDQQLLNTVDWKNWEPNAPTLIVIDYIHLFTEMIATLFLRWSSMGTNDAKSHPLRLLLIDHVFPEHLEDIVGDPRFSKLTSGGPDLDRKRHLLFRERPLLLSSIDQGRDFLAQIMKDAALLHDGDVKQQRIDDALDDLANIKGAWCPLFSALRGRALAERSILPFSDRRDLIHQYLTSTRRLPWSDSEVNTTSGGDHAGNFVAAATARGGASFAMLFACLSPDIGNSKFLRKTIKTRCCSIVAHRNDDYLFPFEPDILGETFFLLAVRHIRELPGRWTEFVEMLCDDDGPGKNDRSVENFIGFGRRLIRNLSNDDQNDRRVMHYWRTLIDFLNPTNFDQSSPIAAASSILLLDVTATLNGGVYTDRGT